MKRTVTGEIKVIGYYSVAGGKYLYLLPFEVAEDWEEKKNTYAIALCWKGKLHFRQVYERKNGYCFKFFNRWIYISDIEFTEGTHEWLLL